MTGLLRGGSWTCSQSIAGCGGCRGALDRPTGLSPSAVNRIVLYPSTTFSKVNVDNYYQRGATSWQPRRPRKRRSTACSAARCPRSRPIGWRSRSSRARTSPALRSCSASSATTATQPTCYGTSSSARVSGLPRDREPGAPSPRRSRAPPSCSATRPALKALKEGEEHGLKEYEEALDDEISPELQSVVRTLISRQQAHIQTLDRLIVATREVTRASRRRRARLLRAAVDARRQDVEGHELLRDVAEVLAQVRHHRARELIGEEAPAGAQRVVRLAAGCARAARG